ncbi:MAG: hypothetical protein JRJ78_03230 [Deltaproteobacteria bacterium]|nr:hypothetical protein [Deltaproteobacteria bacterium]
MGDAQFFLNDRKQGRDDGPGRKTEKPETPEYENQESFHAGLYTLSRSPLQSGNAPFPEKLAYAGEWANPERVFQLPLEIKDPVLDKNSLGDHEQEKNDEY